MSCILLFSTLMFYMSGANADYYWKDYYGFIPDDALEAGMDGGGNPTYIGTTFFPLKEHTVPTAIYSGDRNAYVVVNNELWKTDKNTKILCSRNNTLFRWIPTDTTKIHYLTGCRQIAAGVGKIGIIISVGRANHQGRTLTGRLYDTHEHKWHGLWIHDENEKNVVLKEFEVLTYNCTNPWTEEVV